MANSKVRKAIIPAAGLGTRFLPATKTVPKEMLTIVDAPIIFYVVEEAVQAGIEDIVLIQGRNKEAIEDFFDTSYELEDTLAKTGKINLLERLIKIREMANIVSVRQKQPLGLGHAVLCAERIIGDEPFSVLLGDEIMVPQAKQKNTTAQLVDSFHETKLSTVAVMKVADQDVSKYGIANTTDTNSSFFKVSSFQEKPDPSETSSRWALPGRYVFSAEIFNHIRNQSPGKNGEIQLTDAMNKLAQSMGVYASAFSAERFDAGDKLGYIKANIELALRNPDLSKDLKSYILGMVDRLKETR